MGDTHNMSSNHSLARILISCIVLFAAVAATDPSIDGQEFGETLPTAPPDSKFAVGQDMAAAMEEVQDTTKTKSEETSQTGWGNHGWRRRRRRRRRRRWMGSSAERNQKSKAREAANKAAQKERREKHDKKRCYEMRTKLHKKRREKHMKFHKKRYAAYLKKCRKSKGCWARHMKRVAARKKHLACMKNKKCRAKWIAAHHERRAKYMIRRKKHIACMRNKKCRAKWIAAHKKRRERHMKFHKKRYAAYLKKCRKSKGCWAR